MEARGDRKKQAWTLLAEALGTGFLAVGFNWGGVSHGAPVVVGLTLFVVTGTFGPISACHFNPAVTLAMMIKHAGNNDGGSFFLGLLTVVAQLAGAALGCAGSAVAILLAPPKASGLRTALHIPRLCPVSGCNDDGELLGQVFLVEASMTFLFAAFFIQITTYNGAHDAPVNAIALGVALYACCQMSAGISGGCLNPAIGLAQLQF